jgi:hypothetical protein
MSLVGSDMRQHAADQYERVQIAGTVAAPCAERASDCGRDLPILVTLVAAFNEVEPRSL